MERPLWMYNLSRLDPSYQLEVRRFIDAAKRKKQCHKKPQGSMHYGYYVCEFLRHNGRYTNDPKKVYKCVGTDKCLLDEELMNICDDICCFIMKEIIDKDGKYFDPDSELAKPEYQDLVDIDKLELNHEDY